MEEETKKGKYGAGPGRGSVFWKELVKGLVISNPVFILTLGLCPVLAVTKFDR